jgi:DNA-directed RNA polymerase subunit M/transcription elongation factor TFIIS
MVLNTNLEDYILLYNYLDNSTNGVRCKTCNSILSTKELQQKEISHNAIMIYVECPICKDVFDASDFHIKNWSSSSNSPSNNSLNVENNTANRQARLVNNRRRTRSSKIIEGSNILVPILSKASHRYAITIEDILTDCCSAKHEFEYLGIVRTDATIGKDVQWSKCNKCGLDKFKSIPPLRYDGNCD